MTKIKMMATVVAATVVASQRQQKHGSGNGVSLVAAPVLAARRWQRQHGGGDGGRGDVKTVVAARRWQAMWRLALAEAQRQCSSVGGRDDDSDKNEGDSGDGGVVSLVAAPLLAARWRRWRRQHGSGGDGAATVWQRGSGGQRGGWAAAVGSAEVAIARRRHPAVAAG